jgi:nicotinamide riboside kinase
MKIALLGAESTGKTQLSVALARTLRERGHGVTLVPEALRVWCAAQGRTPRADEQAGIAHAQAEAVLGAPTGHWVVADTTPLMTAIYSDMLFADRSLYEFALAHQRCYDVTLVMATDLPWVADGIQRDGPQVRAPVTALLRHALENAGLRYQMVTGGGETRLSRALDAIEFEAARGDSLGLSDPKPLKSGPEHWVCGCCGDADCERRLFSRLRAREG